MVKGDITGCHFEGGFSSLVYDGNLHDEEQPSHPQSNQDRQPVSTKSISPGRLGRSAAVSLALLAAGLLMVDIGLGVHYNKLTDTQLRPNGTQNISNELAKLQDTYKAAVESIEGTKKQLGSEMSRQIPTNWELEHQTRRSKNYEEQLVKKATDTAKLRYQISIISDGCKYCPPGWILMNSVCYYFPFSDSNGVKSWSKAREYCQLYGGDLAIIDSKDKENATVNHLLDYKDRPNPNMGLWIGLKNFPKEDTWRWVDGRALVEGYWNDGEPNSNKEDDEDCGVVRARENFFKAWSNVKCKQQQKWICEKQPGSMS